MADYSKYADVNRPVTVEDHAEGTRSFTEKRGPKFGGR